MLEPESRTFRFFGAVFSDQGGIEIAVKFNGQTVFDGAIPTDRQLHLMPANHDYYSQRQELFACDVDYGTSGLTPLRIEVHGGVLMFGNILANYTMGHLRENMYKTPRVLFESLCWPGDFKRNIVIDGQKLADPIGDHELYYPIRDGIFECDVDLDPLRRTSMPYVAVWHTRIGRPDPFPIKF